MARVSRRRNRLTGGVHDATHTCAYCDMLRSTPCGRRRCWKPSVAVDAGVAAGPTERNGYVRDWYRDNYRVS
jgi:hypothetical protein